MRKLIFCFILIIISTTACSPIDVEDALVEDITEEPEPTLTPTPYRPPVTGPDPSLKVGAFYYTWYNNPETDSKWEHWDQNHHQPPLDISSDYYPVLGAYSSNDEEVIAQHFAWLREAGVGVVITTWWGPGSGTDRIVPLMLDIADHYGLKVTFLIEQYTGRSAFTLGTNVRYLKTTYGSHPAFYWTTETSQFSPDDRKKGLFFIWGTTNVEEGGSAVPFDYWRETLDKLHAEDPGTLVISDEYDSPYRKESHFDGSYNYGVLDVDPVGYTYATKLHQDAWYVPGINPGFSISRIDYPLELDTPRRDGLTYNDRWESMFAQGREPQMVVITTFNEWHEGTQIEPAQPSALTSEGEAYLDYGDLGPEGYLKLTREWVDHFLTYEWPE